jgi:hypothetical protein
MPGDTDSQHDARLTRCGAAGCSRQVHQAVGDQIPFALIFHGEFLAWVVLPYRENGTLIFRRFQEP